MSPEELEDLKMRAHRAAEGFNDKEDTYNYLLKKPLHPKDEINMTIPGAIGGGIAGAAASLPTIAALLAATKIPTGTVLKAVPSMTAAGAMLGGLKGYRHTKAMRGAEGERIYQERLADHANYTKDKDRLRRISDEAHKYWHMTPEDTEALHMRKAAAAKMCPSCKKHKCKHTIIEMAKKAGIRSKATDFFDTLRGTKYQGAKRNLEELQQGLDATQGALSARKRQMDELLKDPDYIKAKQRHDKAIKDREVLGDKLEDEYNKKRGQDDMYSYMGHEITPEPGGSAFISNTPSLQYLRGRKLKEGQSAEEFLKNKYKGLEQPSDIRKLTEDEIDRHFDMAGASKNYESKMHEFTQKNVKPAEESYFPFLQRRLGIKRKMDSKQSVIDDLKPKVEKQVSTVASKKRQRDLARLGAATAVSSAAIPTALHFRNKDK